MQKDIITEALEDFTHSPLFSSVKSESFSLFVDQQRLQLELNIINENTLSQLPDIMNRYVTILSEIPYQAIGFNTKSRISDLETPNILRTIFCGKQNLLNSAFGKDHKIGGLVWYDYDRFKAQFTANYIPDDKIDVDFNYHSNVSGVDDIRETLDRFPLVTAHANNVTNTLLE